VFDGATVQVDRAYAATWPAAGKPVAVVALLTVFKGTVSDIAPSRAQVTLNIKSPLEQLTMGMPRDVFQTGCRYTLFDIGCTLNKDDFAETGTVATVVGTNQFTSALGAPGGSGTYALGRVLMTSGDSQGFARSVRNWDSGTGTFTLLKPFPFGIAPADSFTAYPGCNKTFASCTLFNNTDNFGGQPFIPDAMTAV
jgi:uncharacterized phage protein (TIGR02218 family)